MSSYFRIIMAIFYTKFITNYFVATKTPRHEERILNYLTDEVDCVVMDVFLPTRTTKTSTQAKKLKENSKHQAKDRSKETNSRITKRNKKMERRKATE